MCHWDFNCFLRMDTLYFVFGKYQNASWWCCFNAWLSFWPGIAFGGVPLRFDSKLTGRTFPYSDSGHSEMQARNMIQSLQRLRESLPLSCKCAIGILFFFENGHPLIWFFWKYQSASWWCCFNAWLSFWPGIAFGGVPLRFDSKLTGHTFPYSDSGHS